MRMHSEIIPEENFIFSFKGMEESNHLHFYASSIDPNEYSPIGKQLTIAYNNCMEHLEGFQNSYMSVSKEIESIEQAFTPFNPDPKIFDRTKPMHEKLREYDSEIERYNVLKIMFETYSKNSVFDPKFILHGFSFIPYNHLPKILYSYMGMDEKKGAFQLEELYKDISHLPEIEIVYYVVNDDFEYCLASLDYLCTNQLLLRKCVHCNKFFIAEHGNENVCSKECRADHNKEVKRKSAAEPLNKAKKYVNNRIQNRASIKSLTIDSFAFTNEHRKKRAQKCISNDDKVSLKILIEEELQDRIKTGQSQNDIIEWLNNAGRQRKMKGDRNNGNGKA